MKISKKQINKAGEIIRNGTVNEKEQTIELLNLWRSSRMLPLSNIRALVDSRLKKLSINCIVGQRLKRMPSIIGKITRFPDMSVSTMQDVGGIRIIVPKIRIFCLWRKRRKWTGRAAGSVIEKEWRREGMELWEGRIWQHAFSKKIRKLYRTWKTHAGHNRLTEFLRVLVKPPAIPPSFCSSKAFCSYTYCCQRVLSPL